ncbi:MAG TPA: cyclopropane-fatty-acyl-phospholipid synthase family protein [Gemmatimonadaceae bacterium]|nr:cyclopropane-fatty-acyl-phospholipid synthase family protein [Gemmatimonadaceae bacterium]
MTIVFGPAERRGFGVRLWDDSIDGAEGAAPFTLVVRRPGALRRALLPPSELALVEAYLRDDLDVEGDLGTAGRLGDLAAARLRSPRALLRLARVLRALPSDDGDAAGAQRPTGTGRRVHRGRVAVMHTRGRDATAVRHHYDVGNDFYALWLGRRSLYSCAYFPIGTEDLDAAQEVKLEHICRKLRLSPGEHLLDIGCGWGGLLEYAATHHGVSGVGITLSAPQADAARARLAAAGLDDRVRIELRDYRDIPPDWRFDKVVSVGMREHVGAARLPAYFAAAHQALRPGGLFLDHGIVRGGSFEQRGAVTWMKRRLWKRDAFIQRYVFPDGELVPLGTLVGDAEHTGLEVRDVENLREHYVRTLRCWVERLEHAHAEAVALVGEHTYRVWRLYMAATTLGFASGRLTLVQTLLAKPLADGSVSVPPSRADVYRQ